MAHIQHFVDQNQRMFKKTLSYYIMHITVALLDRKSTRLNSSHL